MEKLKLKLKNLNGKGSICSVDEQQGCWMIHSMEVDVLIDLVTFGSSELWRQTLAWPPLTQCCVPPPPLPQDS